MIGYPAEFARSMRPSGAAREHEGLRVVPAALDQEHERVVGRGEAHGRGPHGSSVRVTSFPSRHSTWRSSPNSGSR